MVLFMQVFDIIIVNVLLLIIVGNFGVSLQQVIWVIILFVVSMVIVLLLIGWVSCCFGECKLFVWVILVFVIILLLCGFVQSMGMLVVLCVLQGFVVGLMYLIMQLLLVLIYLCEKCGQVLVLLVMIMVVVLICGLIFGGWIIDNYSWEWIFLINVLLGIFVVLVVGNQLKGCLEQIEKLKMDYVGLVMLVIGVGVLQLVFDLGNDEDWFLLMKIVVLVCVVVVMLMVFLIWELIDKDLIVDLKLFWYCNFCVGMLVMVVVYVVFFSVVLLILQWLQCDMGYIVIWVGLVIVLIGILLVIMMLFVGKYVLCFDMWMLVIVVFIVLLMISFLCLNFNLQVDYMYVVGVQLIMGIGVVLFFMLVLQILLLDLDGCEIVVGFGLVMFLCMLGGSFVVLLMMWLWVWCIQVYYVDLIEYILVYQLGMQEQVIVMGQGDL